MSFLKNLTKPICFFDLETTGISIVNDRIVEISVLKIEKNGEEISKTWLVNPTIPIPKIVSSIHGITDEMVKDKPTFKDVSNEIFSFIKDCDLAGFNSNKFDVPMLAEEFLRVEKDLDISKIKLIDVQNIFHKKEKRTLSAAYKFYCNKIHDNAHSSMSDTRATFEVLLAQLDKYEDLEDNVDFLSKFSTQKKFVDLAGFIHLNSDLKPTFSFGKYKGKEVDEIIETDPGYFSWILNADFPRYTKKVLNKIRLSKINNKLLWKSFVLVKITWNILKN